MKKKVWGSCPRDYIKRDPIRKEVREHSRKIKEIAERTARVEEGLDFILNKVSANGRPGLENSLKDIHSEIKAIGASIEGVLDATKSARAWSDVRKSIRGLLKESAFFAVIGSKIGRTLLAIALLLVVNSILHAVGIGLDLQSILRVIP